MWRNATRLNNESTLRPPPLPPSIYEDVLTRSYLLCLSNHFLFLDVTSTASVGVTNQEFINRPALGHRPGPGEHDPRNDVITSAKRAEVHKHRKYDAICVDSGVYLLSICAPDDGCARGLYRVGLLSLRQATARLGSAGGRARGVCASPGHDRPSDYTCPRRLHLPSVPSRMSLNYQDALTSRLVSLTTAVAKQRCWPRRCGSATGAAGRLPTSSLHRRLDRTVSPSPPGDSWRRRAAPAESSASRLAVGAAAAAGPDQDAACRLQRLESARRPATRPLPTHAAAAGPPLLFNSSEAGGR